ncbi:MAG TPA: hypothetical protein VMZ91_07810 [Candidatus Paceibacterota bacterium]|nr:hypothetical protein [Candidatus Paceibacterota bacterium]
MKDTIKGFKLFENAIEELNNSFQGKPPTTKEGKKMLKAMNKIIAEKVKEARENERMKIARKLAEGMTKEAVISLICKQAIRECVIEETKKEVKK